MSDGKDRRVCDKETTHSSPTKPSFIRAAVVI